MSYFKYNLFFDNIFANKIATVNKLLIFYKTKYVFFKFKNQNLNFK